MFTMMLESSDIKNWNEIYEKLKNNYEKHSTI